MKSLTTPRISFQYRGAFLTLPAFPAWLWGAVARTSAGQRCLGTPLQSIGLLAVRGVEKCRELGCCTSPS